MKFNEYLKSLIKRSGFSNADLARRIGVHKSYITQLINSHCSPPSKERCNQIADVLGCKEQERTELLFSAIEGRMSEDALEFFNMFKSKEGNNHFPVRQRSNITLQGEIVEVNASPALNELSKGLFNLTEERKISPKIEKHPVEKILENVICEFRNAETVDCLQETIGNCACDVFRFGNTEILKGHWEARESVKQAVYSSLTEQHRIITMVSGSAKVRFAKTNDNGKEYIIHENTTLCFPAHLGYEMLTITVTDALFVCTDLFTKV